MQLDKKFVRKLGRDFGSGLIDSLLYFLVFVLIASVAIDYFRPTDDTDKNWFSRSGVKIITDKATGCQYLVGQSGGVVRREGVPCAK